MIHLDRLNLLVLNGTNTQHNHLSLNKKSRTKTNYKAILKLIQMHVKILNVIDSE